MPRKKTDSLMRDQVDRKMDAIRNVLSHQPNIWTSPEQGWIKTLREALGMSLGQLARRLKMTPQSLADIEKSEKKGTISLLTLKKVAQALNADVKCTIVPSIGIKDQIRNQAKKVASRIVRNTQTHMELEDQGNSDAYVKKRIEEVAEELVRRGDRRIWDEK